MVADMLDKNKVKDMLSTMAAAEEALVRRWQDIATLEEQFVDERRRARASAFREAAEAIASLDASADFDKGKR